MPPVYERTTGIDCHFWPIGDGGDGSDGKTHIEISVTAVTPVTKQKAEAKNGFSGIEPKAAYLAQSDLARNGSEPFWLRFSAKAERVSRTAPTFPPGSDPQIAGAGAPAARDNNRHGLGRLLSEAVIPLGEPTGNDIFAASLKVS